MSRKNINEFENTPIKDIIEKPKPKNAPSNLAVLGRYILPPQIFDFLKDINPDDSGEIQLNYINDQGEAYGLCLATPPGFNPQDWEIKTGEQYNGYITEWELA